MLTLEKVSLAYPDEEWAGIEGFSNYVLSDHGKVFSLKHGRFIGTNPDRHGYHNVSLVGNIKVDGHNGRQDFKVHRLVLMTFSTNPLNKRTCNHKDGNKGNNHIDNLEWATDSENMLHAYKEGLQKPMIGSSNPKSKAVIQVDPLTREIVGEYESCNMAAKDLNIEQSGITAVCNNKIRRYKGFYWMFRSDFERRGIPNPLPTKKTVAKKVIQADLLGNDVRTFNSAKEAEAFTGVLRSKISQVCNGKRNKAGGYRWRFA